MINVNINDNGKKGTHWLSYITSIRTSVNPLDHIFFRMSVWEEFGTWPEVREGVRKSFVFTFKSRIIVLWCLSGRKLSISHDVVPTFFLGRIYCIVCFYNFASHATGTSAWHSMRRVISTAKLVRLIRAETKSWVSTSQTASVILVLNHNLVHWNKEERSSLIAVRLMSVQNCSYHCSRSRLQALSK